MEPAKIDWKNVEWRFVEDKAYERINAPKWFDFLNPNDNNVDDQAWFCRPECKHPRTAEDFLSSSPPKVPSPAVASAVSPLPDKTLRDVKLKRRGLTQASVYPTNDSRFKEDSENQNPNLSTPPISQAKAMKAGIKSSTEKKLQPIETPPHNNEVLPRLKSTLSARNLFAGRDILNQITDFCTELKRLAMRAREREDVERMDVRKSLGLKEEFVKKEEYTCEVLSELNLNGKQTERMPLLDVGKQKTERMALIQVKTEGTEGSILKEKQRIKKRVEETENAPISVSLQDVKRKGGESLLQIRTNPPSPQCFSAPRPPSKLTPLQAPKAKPKERGILEAAEQHKTVTKEEDSTNNGKSVCSAVDGREGRTMDVFWFLKPCTTLSS